MEGQLAARAYSPTIAHARPPPISWRVNHERYSDDYIADILREARVFAFVGAWPMPRGRATSP